MSKQSIRFALDERGRPCFLACDGPQEPLPRISYNFRYLGDGYRFVGLTVITEDGQTIDYPDEDGESS
jgi:hypothetical protein